MRQGSPRQPWQTLASLGDLCVKAVAVALAFVVALAFLVVIPAGDLLLSLSLLLPLHPGAPMPIVVVGGHTRNIGKTSVVAGLIAALPDRHWTAIKITQFGHNVCSANGEPCDCETADHTIAVSEERDASTGTDTSRFLAAGARRVFWVRTRQGQLAEAMPRVRKLLAEAENIILESNSVLRF